MIWGLGLLVLFVVLLIPILAIVLHSPLGRSLAARSDRTSSKHLEDLTKRVLGLEDELEELTRTFGELREETQFLQNLLQHPERRSSLPPPKS